MAHTTLHRFLHRLTPRVFWLAFAILAVAIGIAAGRGFISGDDARAVGQPLFVDGEVIVKFKKAVPQEEQQVVEREFGDRTKETLSRINARLLEVTRGRSVERAIAEYRQDPRVAYAEPNYIVHAVATPNDTRFGELYGLLNTGQVIRSVTGTPDADIDATDAWNSTTGSSNVVIGVVDTGIDYNHPDLAQNVWSNPGGIGGCPAGTHGFNAITRNCNPFDDHSHGTHVSGTVGAVGNNDTGVTGVNWTTSIMGLKFLNAYGSGTIADAIAAIDFAIQAKLAGVNVRVLSNSWGGGGFSQALLDAINNANANDILFVAAAGNSGKNSEIYPLYPASYTAPNIISVAATDNRDRLASFSNYGSTSVDLGAPGVSVLSTTPNSSYSYFSGTSMATPHVSGAAGLILSSEPTLTTADLKARIFASVDPLSWLWGKTVTGGRLNVCRAIVGCVPESPPPAPVPPPDFSLSISPSWKSVSGSGGTLTYTIYITRSSANTNPIDLSISGLPAATGSVTINPDPATGSSSKLSFVVFATTTPGTYTFTVTGVDTVTGLTKSAKAKFSKW